MSLRAPWRSDASDNQQSNIHNMEQTNPWSRSEHMKMLHAQGRYQGTSKIGAWNVSDEKRQRMAAMRVANALDKSSHGYGSEYHMREVNRELLHNKFQGETGYMYEPWHIRYLGNDLAKTLYNNGNWITLENHLGISSKY